MKNFKVRAKLLISFGVILAMIAAILCAVFVSGMTTNNNITSFHDRAFVGVELADELELLVNIASRDTLHAAIDPNRMNAVVKVSNAKASLQEMLGTITELREIYTGDAAILDEMTSEVKKLSGILDAEIELLIGEDKEASYNFYEEKILPAREHVSELAAQLVEYEEGVAAELYADTKSNSTTMTLVAAVIGAIAIVTGIFFSIYITKMLCSGINDVHLAAEEMAKGNFNVNVKYKSRDELGEMGNAIESLAQILRLLSATLMLFLTTLRTEILLLKRSVPVFT